MYTKGNNKFLTPNIKNNNIEDIFWMV